MEVVLKNNVQNSIVKDFISVWDAVKILLEEVDFDNTFTSLIKNQDKEDMINLNSLYSFLQDYEEIKDKFEIIRADNEFNDEKEIGLHLIIRLTKNNVASTYLRLIKYKKTVGV